MIIERFEEICAQEGNKEHLLELDLENLLSILKSDKLNLINEVTLVHLVRDYMDVRDKIPSKVPETAEEKAGPDLWALLTDSEKETRDKAFKEEEEKRNEAQNEAREKDAELYFKKESIDRLQHVLDIKQKERNE